MGDSDSGIGVRIGTGSNFSQFGAGVRIEINFFFTTGIGVGIGIIIFKWSRNRSRSQNARVESESEPGPSGTAYLWLKYKVPTTTYRSFKLAEIDPFCTPSSMGHRSILYRCQQAHSDRWNIKWICRIHVKWINCCCSNWRRYTLSSVTGTGHVKHMATPFLSPLVQLALHGGIICIASFVTDELSYQTEKSL